MKNRFFLATVMACFFFVTNAQAASYTEDFEAPFPAWESGWLATNSNLTNYYGVGGNRGNNPDGLWIGVTDIIFNGAFGAGISSLSFDVASWGNGTVNFYDISDVLISSNPYIYNKGALTDPGTYQNISVNSANGISHFQFVTDSYSILGNTSIDNVNINITAVPEPETYLMMLMGLGLMGFVVCSRKNEMV
jgi:hypothetical protein